MFREAFEKDALAKTCSLVREAVQPAAHSDWEDRPWYVRFSHKHGLFGPYQWDTESVTAQYDASSETLRRVEIPPLTFTKNRVSVEGHPRSVVTEIHNTLVAHPEIDCDDEAFEVADATYQQMLDDIRNRATLSDAVTAVQENDTTALDILFNTAEDNTVSSRRSDHIIRDIVANDVLVEQITDDKAVVMQEEHEGTPDAGRGARRRRNRTPERQEGYVIGTDDTPTGFFVHPIDVTHLSEPSRATATAIRNAMGYDTEYHNGMPSEGRRYRVQGDLKLKCLEQFQANPEIPPVICRLRGNDPTFDVSTVAAEVMDSARCMHPDNVYGERRARVTSLDRHDHDSVPLLVQENAVCYYGSDERWTIEPSDGMLNIHRFDLPNGELRRSRSSGLPTRERLASELEWVVHDAEWSIDRDKKEHTDQFGRYNLQLDNHLLIFDDAARYPLSPADNAPVVVVVPRRSEVAIYHDEHDTVRVPLRPGAYSVDLLRRGIAVWDETNDPW